MTVNSSFAEVRSSRSPASRPLKRVLIGMSVAPAQWTPRAATAHSEVLGAHTATRSPGRMPRAIKARAAAWMRSRYSA